MLQGLLWFCLCFLAIDLRKNQNENEKKEEKHTHTHTHTIKQIFGGKNFIDTQEIYSMVDTPPFKFYHHSTKAWFFFLRINCEVRIRHLFKIMMKFYN